ncbi:MAG: hypothetical protein ACMVO3_07165 [Thalassobaculum sp.]
MSDKTPTVRLNKGGGSRLLHGHPWGFSNEIEMTPETKALAPGSVVAVETRAGEGVGLAHLNPHSLIALRMLDRTAERAIELRLGGGTAVPGACLARAALRTRPTIASSTPRRTDSPA